MQIAWTITEPWNTEMVLVRSEENGSKEQAVKNPILNQVITSCSYIN